jgi:endonuclease/exonuclease/phosphatase family metal-dependent hydrolase
MSAVSLSRYSPIDQQRPEWRERLGVGLRLVGSWLIEPACTARTWRWLAASAVNDVLHRTASPVGKCARQALLVVGAAFAIILSLITVPTGMLFRYCGTKIQSHDFSYYCSDATEIDTSAQKLSTLHWNICGIPGYAMTDGGVLPWERRIGAIADFIIDQDSDIVFLNEVFDTRTSQSLIEELGDAYRHFYYDIGPNGIPERNGSEVFGPGSGLFVASKRPISEAAFQPFTPEEKWGRARNSRKGFFSCKIDLGAGLYVRSLVTHLQHNEIVASSHQEEKSARTRELDAILTTIKTQADSPWIVGGDFNAWPEELNEHHQWLMQFQQDAATQNQATYLGDAFCAHLVGKIASTEAIKLDYCMGYPNQNLRITTTVLPTEYSSAQFIAAALSDHFALKSDITIL